MISLNRMSRGNSFCRVVLANSRSRAMCTSAIVGLLAIGCEGGSVIAFDTPAVSTPVPALSELVTNPLATVGTANEPLLADESQLIADNSSAPETTVVPAEPAVEPQPLEPEPVANTSQPVDTNTVESLDVQVVAAPATSTGISAQARSLLTDALSRGGVRIMPTGDSITHGIGGSSSYRRELAGLLDAAGCSYRMVGSQSQSLQDAGFYGAHEGYSGHTADYFLTGKQTNTGNNAGISDSVSYQNPDLVILHIGSVDLFKGQTVESTIEDISAIIDTIHQNKPDTVVIVANVIPWYNDSRDANLPNAIRSLGNRIQEMVQRSSNPLLSMADVRSGYTQDMMQSDLIHPKLAGDKHIANAIFDSFYSDTVCK